MGCRQKAALGWIAGSLCALVVLLCSPESAFGKLELTRLPAWEANGEVSAVTRVGSTVFLGGRFTYVGPHTGSAAAIDRSSGRWDPLFPTVEGGIVRAVEPDGVGGVYLGGSFTSVGGVPRRGLAHVLPDGKVDPAFAPFVSSAADDPPNLWPHTWMVLTLARVDTRLYVGGEFGWIGGTARTGLAAVATETGAVESWNPHHLGTVSDIEAGTDAVYVTTNGGFVVNGAYEPRNGVGEIDPVSGMPTSWAPPLSHAEALARSGSTLYVGGNLLGPQPTLTPYSLAALDVVTHEPVAWSPPVFSGSIRELLVSGSTLYVQGDFTSPRHSLAAVNRTTGELLPFDAGSSRWATALALDGSSLVVGRVTNPGGVSATDVELLDATTGTSTAVLVSTENVVHAVVATASRIVVGGEFRSIGGVRRKNLAAVDVTTGEATPIDVPVTGLLVPPQVRALTAIGSVVYVGGTFDSIGGVGRTDLAAIDANSGAVLPWAPSLSCPTSSCDTYVTHLATDGASVYIVGNFEAIGGSPRAGIGAVTTGGETTAFAPLASASPAPVFGRVSTIVPADGRVYLGGDFLTINGESQPYLAALDPATGERLPWTPAVNGPVTGIAAAGNRVYLAGQFSRLAGSFQPRLASVDTFTGGLDPAFNPQVSTVVDAITTVGPQVVIAAAGGEIDNRLVEGIVGLDRANGDLSIPAGAQGYRALPLATGPDGWLGAGAGSFPHFSGFLSFAATATEGGDMPPPATGGGGGDGGGGGGGGGGGSADVAISLSASNVSPAPNTTVEIRVAVTNRSPNVAAHGLRATIALPTDATLLGPPAYETGSGCTGTSTLSCNLDFLAPNATSTLRFAINPGGAGVKQITASTTMSLADPDLANNTGALTLDVKLPAQPAPPAVGPRAPTVKVISGNARANTLNGTAGRDLLRGLGGNDKLFGRGGDDTLLGGSGNDRLVGGPGKDKLDGGTGADTIEARDGARDTIVCGLGRDTVVADRADVVGKSCELVRRR